MSLLGCLLTVFLGLFLFAFSLFGGLIRFVARLLGLDFQVGQHKRSQGGGGKQGQTHSSTSQAHTSSKSQKGKIFERDNSEYVDFEEIKN